MGFVKSKAELDRYYGLGVRKFVGAKMTGVMFGADPDITAGLLPPPLEQAAMPGGLIFIAEYPETNLGPGYREAALFLRCQYRGETGSYCLSMPIDNEPRMHNGRDIFGFPKKMAEINFQREGQVIHGWVEREGVRFVELEVNLASKMSELPPTGPTFLFKGMPRIDLKPGFDGPVHLARQKTEVELRSLEVGTAELTLRPSEADPWAELGEPSVIMAFYLESDNTMMPGEVITEVDPDLYLPHYYKMTDFSAGATVEGDEPVAPEPEPQARPATTLPLVAEEKAPVLVSFATNETQQMMVRTAREFGREVLGPAEIALDRIADPEEAFASDLFWDTMGQAFELGFHKMGLKEEHGGLGLDQSTTGMVWEELARHGVGFAASLMAGSVVPQLVAFLAADNKELAERFIKPFCQEDDPRQISAWGSSEPDVGSDGKNYFEPSVRHRTTAVKKGDRYILNGTKSSFVSNGGIAGVYVVFACVEPSLGIRGSGAFVVPADAKGVGRGKAVDRLGLRALNQAPIHFTDVDVPAEHMIFPPGESYPFLHNAIVTVGNLGTGYLAVGLLRAAYEEALAYSKERVQWGKPIFEHQLVARKLFEAHAAIESSRSLLWRGSWLSRTQFPGDLKTSLTAKIQATNLTTRHTAEMVQVLGGYGIARDYPLEKYMRDAPLLQIMDGTNDTLMMKAAGLL